MNFLTLCKEFIYYTINISLFNLMYNSHINMHLILNTMIKTKNEKINKNSD